MQDVSSGVGNVLTKGASRQQSPWMAQAASQKQPYLVNVRMSGCRALSGRWRHVRYLQSRMFGFNLISGMKLVSFPADVVYTVELPSCGIATANTESIAILTWREDMVGHGVHWLTRTDCNGGRGEMSVPLTAH